MTGSREQSEKSTAKEHFWLGVRVFRKGLILVVLWWMVCWSLVWLWPWSLIFLEALALIWCLVRMGEGKRYSLRGLLILTAGVAVIVATAVFVPAPMLGGGGGIPNKRVIIEVVDESTHAPINNAEVALTSRVARQTTTQQSATDAEGIAELTCDVGAGITHSLLRTWRTYSTDGWQLEARAAGYLSESKTLSDVVSSGEGGGPLRFRIELQRSTQ
jgi:hypothetical protein